ncbi:MAG: methyltransferase [Alphaproteobacteria bacterium]
MSPPDPEGADAPFPPVDPARADQFVRAATRLERTPLVPELRLFLASEVMPLWRMTEEDLAARGLPPPFWAFAWAGGQALARHVLDHPDLVAGRHVLDFASGCGIGAIAAMKAGAASVLAVDIDPFAVAAIEVNAAANGVTVEALTVDLVGGPVPDRSVVLAGDICYEQPLADRVEAWLRMLAQEGALVLIGDPGRTHLPQSGLMERAVYRVETTRELEDSAVRRTGVWQVQTAVSPDQV